MFYSFVRPLFRTTNISRNSTAKREGFAWMPAVIAAEPPSAAGAAVPFVRRHGFQRPLNGAQLGAWLALLYFALVHFGLICPNFPLRWQPLAYQFAGGLCLAFASLIFICTAYDPRDDSVRYSTAASRPLTLDRSQRQHVIMDQHCYFCQTKVGQVAGWERHRQFVGWRLAVGSTSQVNRASLWHCHSLI